MREEILHRARTMWDQRGQPKGEDLSIWLQAEAQIRGGEAPDMKIRPKSNAS